MQEKLQPKYYEQRETLRMLQKPQPVVIGIEGGPCSGKTTLVNRLLSADSKRNIVCLPEAATEHIMKRMDQGIDIAAIEQSDRGAWIELEKDVLGTIVRNINEAVDLYQGTDTIIIADRCDIGAYVTEEEYKRVLSELGLAMPPLLSHVDQLYFLPSVARVKPSLYERLKQNNPARLESLERAQSVCAANLEAVARHPELHLEWNENFEEVLDRIERSVLTPDVESEVKLMPRSDHEFTDFLGRGTVLSSSSIKQTYHRLDGTLFRLRETTTDRDETMYSFTLKSGNGIKRNELQRRIDQATYETLLHSPEVGEPLLKYRAHFLTHEGEGAKRLWAVDRYLDRRIGEWTLETDVMDNLEAAEVVAAHIGFEQTSLGAETLAKNLGMKALNSEMLR